MILILLLILSLGSPALAFSAETSAETRIDFFVDLLVKLHPPYVWGGAWGPLGNDCSGSMYWVFRKSGVPVPRTTALAMWNGAWPGTRTLAKDEARENTQFPDLIFFDYSIGRPRGHVGIIRWNVMSQMKRNIMFAEASSSAKRFKETLILQNDSRWKATHGVLKPKLRFGAGPEK